MESGHKKQFDILVPEPVVECSAQTLNVESPNLIKGIVAPIPCFLTTQAHKPDEKSQANSCRIKEISVL